MQRLQSGMDGTLSRSDLGEDEKAKQFLQLQNRYLTFKQQLNAPLPTKNKPEEMNTSQPVVLPASPGDSTTVTAPSTLLNPFNVAPNLNQGAILQGPKATNTVKSRRTDPSSHSKITVIITFTPKEKKAADSFCKLLRR